jgi:hypothetical protein
MCAGFRERGARPLFPRSPTSCSVAVSDATGHKPSPRCKKIGRPSPHGQKCSPDRDGLSITRLRKVSDCGGGSSLRIRKRCRRHGRSCADIGRHATMADIKYDTSLLRSERGGSEPGRTVRYS